MAREWTMLDAGHDLLASGLSRLGPGLAVERLWLLGEPVPPPRVGIVGTRTPDGTGLITARRLAEVAASQGWGVVSGGALGIDAAAHEGCLRARGRTLVVSAAGAGSTYPRQNLPLFRRIVSEGGGIITESEPGSPLARYRFLARNRMIAALSDMIIVVQARYRSGALNTAGWAKKLGVPVLAVPGSPLNPLHAGPNRLVARGEARLIESLSGPFETMHGRKVQKRRRLVTGGARRRIERLLGSEPMGVDQLAREARMGPADVQSTLLELELVGLARRETSGRWVRNPALPPSRSRSF